MKLLLEASNFAARKHAGQIRKGATGEPYINHPLEVAYLLIEYGDVSDEDVLAAAVLHDTLEDTDASREEIEHNFGRRVADMVVEMTDDKSLSKEERKRLQVIHAPGLSDGAKLIKIADKISNVEDIGDNPPLGWSDDRKLKYVNWATEVVKATGVTDKRLLEKFEKARNLALEGIA